MIFQAGKPFLFRGDSYSDTGKDHNRAISAERSRSWANAIQQYVDRRWTEYLSSAQVGKPVDGMVDIEEIMKAIGAAEQHREEVSAILLRAGASSNGLVFPER